MRLLSYLNLFKMKFICFSNINIILAMFFNAYRSNHFSLTIQAMIPKTQQSTFS
jgi:hypothetical protein